jgi:hypothetical protein
LTDRENFDNLIGNSSGGYWLIKILLAEIFSHKVVEWFNEIPVLGTVIMRRK